MIAEEGAPATTDANNHLDEIGCELGSRPPAPAPAEESKTVHVSSPDDKDGNVAGGQDSAEPVVEYAGPGAAFAII